MHLGVKVKRDSKQHKTKANAVSEALGSNKCIYLLFGTTWMKQNFIDNGTGDVLGAVLQKENS